MIAEQILESCPSEGYHHHQLVQEYDTGASLSIKSGAGLDNKPPDLGHSHDLATLPQNTCCGPPVRCTWVHESALLAS